MKTIAYLRVSTNEQSPNRQIDGLKAHCDELHTETISAVSKCRPVYENVIASLNAGDTFLIWDLDRAYRNAKDALTELDKLKERGIAIRIANLDLDTSTPHGMLIYTVISALAEFERSQLSERTKQGIEAARKRGRRIGRPPKLTPLQLLEAREKLRSGTYTKAAIASELGVNAWTLTRLLGKCDRAHLMQT